MLKLYLYKPQPLVLPQHHEDGKDTDLNDPLWTGKSRNEMSQQGQCSTSHSDSKTTEQLSPSSRKEHLHYVFNVWESLPNEERNLPLASFPLERDLPRAEGPTKNHWTSSSPSQQGGRCLPGIDMPVDFASMGSGGKKNLCGSLWWRADKVTEQKKPCARAKTTNVIHKCLSHGPTGFGHRSQERKDFEFMRNWFPHFH